LGIRSNQVWGSIDLSAGALVVRQSDNYDEYAVNRAGLLFVHEALKAGKIKRAVLVLWQWHDDLGIKKIVMQKPIAEVVASVEGIAARDGEYWWFLANGMPQAERDWSRSTPRPFADEDIPF
jgi:hypothetical protein